MSLHPDPYGDRFSEDGTRCASIDWRAGPPSSEVNKNVEEHTKLCILHSWCGMSVFMKASEFRRWLRQQGVGFIEGARHTRLTFNGRHSTLPRHACELGEGLRRAILKQLGLETRRQDDEVRSDD